MLSISSSTGGHGNSGLVISNAAMPCAAAHSCMPSWIGSPSSTPRAMDFSTESSRCVNAPDATSSAGVISDARPIITIR